MMPYTSVFGDLHHRDSRTSERAGKETGGEMTGAETWAKAGASDFMGCWVTCVVERDRTYLTLFEVLKEKAKRFKSVGGPGRRGPVLGTGLRHLPTPGSRQRGRLSPVLFTLRRRTATVAEDRLH